MRYKRELELVLDVQNNAVLNLRYIAPLSNNNNSRSSSCCCPLEKAFFLDCIRAHITTSSSVARHKPSHLLRLVAEAWDEAGAVTRHVRLLNLSFPTTVRRDSADSCSRLRVTASLLLAPLRTRVEAGLSLEVGFGDGVGSNKNKSGVEVRVVPEAKVVYGEPFDAGKMREFLAGRVIGAGAGAGNGDGHGNSSRKVSVVGGWDEAFMGLYRKLLAKGGNS
jgi:kinetochore protein Spc7/SPC105